MRGSGLINIPLRICAFKRALEQSKMDGIISDGIGGTPHVEISDMVRGIFTSKVFEHGNVGGELGWHNRPTNIVVDRIIDQLIEIGETEACHEGEQGSSLGSSYGCSASNNPSIRAGVSTSIRPWNRHGGGNRGRTISRGRN